MEAHNSDSMVFISFDGVGGFGCSTSSLSSSGVFRSRKALLDTTDNCEIKSVSQHNYIFNFIIADYLFLHKMECQLLI